VLGPILKRKRERNYGVMEVDRGREIARRRSLAPHNSSGPTHVTYLTFFGGKANEPGRTRNIAFAEPDANQRNSRLSMRNCVVMLNEFGIYPEATYLEKAERGFKNVLSAR